MTFTKCEGLQMKKRTESELVKKLRGARSFRSFENYLNENIPSGMPGTTTFASAWNWVNNIHPVNGACLMAWIAFYPDGDPRHELAKDILALRLSNNEEYSPADQVKIMKVLEQ
jgi:hypothetical protein